MPSLPPSSIPGHLLHNRTTTNQLRVHMPWREQFDLGRRSAQGRGSCLVSCPRHHTGSGARETLLPPSEPQLAGTGLPEESHNPLSGLPPQTWPATPSQVRLGTVAYFTYAIRQELVAGPLPPKEQ